MTTSIVWGPKIFPRRHSALRLRRCLQSHGFGDQGGTTTYRYNKANELDKITEPSGRTDLFAYNQLGLRSHTWYATSGGGNYNGNSFVAPTGFAAHIFQEYDNAGKLTHIKTTRASSDLATNVLSELYYNYTVPTPTTCPNAVAGKATDTIQSINDFFSAKITNYCYDGMGRLTQASTVAGPTYNYGWDLNTNRTSDQAGSHSFNDADQLIDSGFNYDAEGNQTASPSIRARSTTESTRPPPSPRPAVPLFRSATPGWGNPSEQRRAQQRLKTECSESRPRPPGTRLPLMSEIPTETLSTRTGPEQTTSTTTSTA